MYGQPDLGDILEREMELIWNEDDNDFRVLRAPSDVDASRKLYVLIHPGDVIQKMDDLEGNDQDVIDLVYSYSMDCQGIMGEELSHLDDNWDVVILHRASTAYALCNEVDVDYEYRDAISERNNDENACMLWGDDLKAAAEYIRDTLKAGERPLVVMAGAWSHVDGGCVEGVGKVLDDGITVLKTSQGTCISPDGSDKEWMPRLGKASYAELASIASPAP